VTALDDRQGLAHPVDPDDWQWQARAACQGADSSTFFLGEGNPAKQLEAARAICADCPVFLECLEFATFTMPQEYGVWAGSTPEDRRALRADTLTPDSLHTQCQDAKLLAAKEKHGKE
jgi:WhiB family redox-sensing transcriptional regulator